MPRFACLAGALAFAFLPAVSGFAQQGTPLAGGASSIQETYQDWQVICAQNAAGKRCVQAQQQNQKDGRLLLRIELAPAPGGPTPTTILLPFGLELAKGIALRVDGKAVGDRLAFRTCRPNGCLVAFDASQGALNALRTGAVLEIVATVADTGQELKLKVSLKGFTPALERAVALAR